MSDLAPRDETHDIGGKIACPWCGHLHGDLWDHEWGDEAIEVECSCGKYFDLCRRVSVDYSARPVAPRSPA